MGNKPASEKKEEGELTDEEKAAIEAKKAVCKPLFEAIKAALENGEDVDALKAEAQSKDCKPPRKNGEQNEDGEKREKREKKEDGGSPPANQASFLQRN